MSSKTKRQQETNSTKKSSSFLQKLWLPNTKSLKLFKRNRGESVDIQQNENVDHMLSPPMHCSPMNAIVSPRQQRTYQQMHQELEHTGEQRNRRSLSFDSHESFKFDFMQKKFLKRPLKKKSSITSTNTSGSVAPPRLILSPKNQHLRWCRQKQI